MSGAALNQDVEDTATLFRGAMRRLLGGVALLTTHHGGMDYGIVITAVMSLSMEPPSLVVAVNRQASVLEPILKSGSFCVNILNEDQLDLCKAFAATPVPTRFSVATWQRDSQGLPYLGDALAAIGCIKAAKMTFGSHQLIAGEARDVYLRDDIAPLAYLDGAYVGTRVL